MAELQGIIDRHQTAPVTSQCYEELGRVIRQHSQPELQSVFESHIPKYVHQELLQLTAAKLAGCLGPLEDGLKSECKYVSEFCLKSDLLFSSSKTRLLDLNFLLPLLQTVSLSTRNRILWNLGKHMPTSNNSNFTSDDADALYYGVVKVWGSQIARPLLCQTSEKVLERELPRNCRSMSKCHMFIIARKFPFLMLSIMEHHSVTPTVDVAQYVVRKTIPKSLDYIVKHRQSLSKSTMKIILNAHSNLILDSPSSWVSILDSKTVKRALKPENFELFLIKQLVELKDSYVTFTLMPFLKLLTPSEMSSMMKKVFEARYGCSLTSKLDFWEENTSLLKLLDASDRSSIAVELDIKNKLSNDWLPLMMTDKSIPKLKQQLGSEQNANARALLVGKLIETALINEDQDGLEDICKFIVTRYRNDKCILQNFFNTAIDFSTLSTETWIIVFEAAKKFFNPDDWQTRGAGKLFSLAVKRDGLPALKEFIKWFMKYPYFFSLCDLEDLGNDLRQFCIQEVFTKANMDVEDTLRQLAEFLQLVTKWTATSTVPIIDENVKACILKLLVSPQNRSTAIEFVLANIKNLDLNFIKDCFQHAINPFLISFLFSKDPSIINADKTAERVCSDILENGIGGYVKLLMKLKKHGYTKMLQCMATQSQAVLADQSDTLDSRRCKTAVVLFMLTADCQAFFSTVDPLLPIISNGTVVIPGQETSVGNSESTRNAPLTLSKHQEIIYQGFGWSLSHSELPVVASERLLQFCVSGDLVLFVRDALYSLCTSIPNENAQKMLVMLMEQPVSVKKHSLRLLRVICNISTQEVLLEKLIETEKHLTMRIVLMHVVITCLNESKSATMWLVLRRIMGKLTPADKTIVLEMVHETIPDQFLEEYLHILLEKSKALTDVDHPSVLSSILQQVSNSVAVMSEKFIESLIVEFFLSERFYGNLFCHCAVSDLFLKYLQGIPASCLPTSLSPNLGSSASVGSPKSLNDRQLFLKERLDIASLDGALDVYDPAQGIYPLQRLLMMFIESCCVVCIKQRSKPEIVFDLTQYIDLLLAYLDQFNPSMVFLPYMLVSLTNIKKTNPDSFNSPYILGQEIGKFCDSMALQTFAPLYCYNVPNAVTNFVNMLDFSNTSLLVEVLRGILAVIEPNANNRGDGSCHDLQSMFRLMVVAHILPSKWKVNAEFKEFGQMFLALIKNTPVEVFVFNEN